MKNNARSHSSVIKESHFQEWLKSGIDPEIINLNLKSISGDSAYAHLLYGLDNTARTNTGRLTKRWLDDYNHLHHGGWWCNGVDLLNNFADTNWGCFKPDRPRLDHQKGKPIKYEHPVRVCTELFALKVPDHIWNKVSEYFGIEKEGNNFWQWVINNHKIPLIITEGAKKAATLLTLGLPAIALPGVYNGAKIQKDQEGEEIKDSKGNPISALIPQLEIFTQGNGKREIILAFDADQKTRTSSQVESQIIKLGEIFEASKCLVSVMEWRTVIGKGIDDVLINKGEHFIYAMFNDCKILKEFKVDRKMRQRKLDNVQVSDFIKDEFAVDERLSFNEMSSKIYLDGKEWNLPEQLDIYFHNEYGVKGFKDHFYDAVLYYAQLKTFNPVKEYLEKVHKEATRIPINNLSTRYFGTNSKLDDIKVKKTLIAMVARIFKPGCRVQTALTLYGKEGMKKTGFFEALVGEEFFSSSIEDVEGPEVKRQLNTAWLQELAEVDCITTRKHTGKVKNFISIPRDTYRELYEKRPTVHPRWCCFVASVNKLQFLIDPGDNRRFWVINVRFPKVNTDLLILERDGIIASAIDAFLAGEQWWLTEEEEKENSANNKLYQYEDAYQDLIENYLEDKELVAVQDILIDVLKLEVKEFSKFQNKVGEILQKLGWEKAGRFSRNGERKIWWKRRDDDLSIEAIANPPGVWQASVAKGMAGGYGRVETIDNTGVAGTSAILPHLKHEIKEGATKSRFLPSGKGEWIAFHSQHLIVGMYVEVKNRGVGQLTDYYSSVGQWGFNSDTQNCVIDRSDILKVFNPKTNQFELPLETS